ncbi:MAG: hypothetical protein KAR40_07620 [Candidatus Sabulitectum sp.]|nr:hypothetical protein [Candidatus Sabulitectum sp.]
MIHCRRRHPCEVYYERCVKKASLKGNTSALQYLKNLEESKQNTLIVTSKPQDSFSDVFWDDDFHDWRDKTVPRSESNRVYSDWKTHQSLLPYDFSLSKEISLRRIANWKPAAGYPGNILRNARGFSRNKKRQKAVALLDGFLYASLLGRISRGAIRELMDWASWKRLLEQKIACGHWELVAEGIRFYNHETKKYDGRSAVYAITPKYLMESYESEKQGGKYNSVAAMENRKRVNPTRRKIEFSEWIHEEHRRFLQKGTGLKVNVDVLMQMLLHPQKYQLTNTSREVWEKAQFGWKTLSPYLNENLTSSWTLGKNGWLYSKKPALQSLPKLIRMLALEGINGEKVAEIDFSGCQLNIARALSGKNILKDPYEGIQWRASDKDIFLHRRSVKRHTLTAFGGRTISDYKYLLRQRKETEPVENFSAVLWALKKLGYPINDSRNRLTQGKIMIEILKRMEEETGFTGLPVHDALLVPASYVEIAEKIMREESENILGVPLPFERLTLFGKAGC